MSWNRERPRIRRWDLASYNMGVENLAHLHKIVPRNQEPQDRFPYHSRPISLSKYPYRQRRRIQNSNFDVIKQSQQKGIIFIWPQKKNFQYAREYTLFVRVLSNLLYWLSAFGFFPSGAAVPFKKPPWKIQQPLPEPENRDYIIEPDWNSVFI